MATANNSNRAKAEESIQVSKISTLSNRIAQFNKKKIEKEFDKIKRLLEY